MPGWFTNSRVFVREFRRTFRTTGAVLPSGRALGRALAANVGRSSQPQRILEVGPGTGSVTERIVSAMGPEDSLDMVELNDRFVQRLRERIDNEPLFQSVAGRCQVLHCPVEEVSHDQPYDLVISGLPLNNFSVGQVEHLLAVLIQHLRPGGTLSFFEYIAIRRAKALVSRGEDRRRLVGIGRALERLFDEHPTHRQSVLPNVPPAWVHHVQTQA